MHCVGLIGKGLRPFGQPTNYNSIVNAKRWLNVIILGAPGGGKGTICKKLINDFDFKHISTGDLLRQSIEKQSDIGLSAKKLMAEGKLVPDDVVMALLTEELKTSNASTSVLLDGFPRTVEQAEMLRRSNSIVSKIDAVISLNVPHETIMERMAQRWIHAPSGRTYSYDYNPPKEKGVDDITGEKLVQREDDKPNIVAARLQGYEKMIAPLLSHYDNDSKCSVKKFHGTESNKIYPFVKEFVELHF